MATLERTMERLCMMSMQPAEKSRIADELKKNFGYSTLGDSIIAIVNRALKKESIATDSEAQVIKGFIDHLPNEALVGPEKFQKLARLLVLFGE